MEDEKDVELFIGAIIAIRDISRALLSLSTCRSIICLFLQSLTDIPVVIQEMDSLHDANGNFICQGDIGLLKYNLERNGVDSSMVSRLEVLHVALVGYSVCINNRDLRQRILKIYNSVVSRPEEFYNLFKNKKQDNHKISYSEIILLVEKFLNSFYAGGTS
ncbi:MAG: hypothetical protein M1338_04135 [Patescibacteria group bacterium]|nr:hypothetical protein [Patescibacteria group bacterium]